MDTEASQQFIPQQSETRTLWCFIEGNLTPFKIVPPTSIDISDLKKLIYAENDKGILRDVNAKDLVLWKLDPSEPLEPEEGLAKRIDTRIKAHERGLGGIAAKLSVSKEVSEFFPRQSAKKHLHIIVQVSPVDGPTLVQAASECPMRLFALSRKRARTGDNDGAGGGGAGDHERLRAQGYEVKSDIIVDDHGDKWEPISKTSDHILTVYRPKDPNKEFIAKKVREISDELEILTLLNNSKFDHVIPLIQSFDGWAILPKMIPVQDYIDNWSEKLESKVVQVCLGLVEGVAYLHWCRVAHRDIKPDNLVVDRRFCLKIIDFDVAMRVQDENEEVDDQCGTKHWMAPEVEKALRHSPIRADRWACGRVLLYLLGKFRTGDKHLEAFARDLCANDPKKRPSLFEWSSSVRAFSGVRNMVSADSRKASKPCQDPMVVDGQAMKAPNAKKLRLHLQIRNGWPALASADITAIVL